MALIAVVGIVLVAYHLYGDAHEYDDTRALAVFGLAVLPVVAVVNPVALVHVTLYTLAFSRLMSRIPAARTGGKHVLYSGLVALAGGSVVLAVALGLQLLLDAEVIRQSAVFSLLIMTPLAVAAPALFQGLRLLRRRLVSRRERL